MQAVRTAACQQFMVCWLHVQAVAGLKTNIEKLESWRPVNGCNNPQSPCSYRSGVCSFFFYICHCEGANARRAARKAIAKCHCEGRRLEQRFKGKRELVVTSVAKRLHEIHVSRTSGSLHVPAITHG